MMLLHVVAAFQCFCFRWQLVGPGEARAGVVEIDPVSRDMDHMEPSSTWRKTATTFGSRKGPHTHL